MPWRFLPAPRTGLWRALHHLLLDWLGDQGTIDWSRASLDTVSIRAKHGDHIGPNPVDRGKPGSKYHLLIDGQGVPLAVGLSAANVQDSMLLEQVVDAVPAIIGPRGRPGHPRKRPTRLHAELAR